MNKNKGAQHMDKNMNIVIKRLTPELEDDYIRFFDVTPHDYETPESRCYCACYSATDSEGVDSSTAEKRRELAKEYIRAKLMDGYLAYDLSDGEKMIGWCNANAREDCRRSYAGRKYIDPLCKPEDAGLRIKSVFCFVIAPEYRRHGIAGLLLDAVCSDAEREGFDVIEAYPLKSFISESADFTGPARLYEKHGYTVHEDLGDRLVVRKKLR